MNCDEIVAVAEFKTADVLTPVKKLTAVAQFYLRSRFSQRKAVLSE